MSNDINNLNIQDAFLLLNGISNVGPVSARNLIQYFDGDPTAIFRANKSELFKVNGVGNKIVDSLINPKNLEWLCSEKKKIENRDASFISQPDLPSILLEIYDPPIGLYVSGNLTNRPFVSIVGTRNPTMYGQKQAREIASYLTEAGFCIVSGMARGIDTAAHEGALDAGGPTIAFLGSGLDIVYPPENINLYQRIIKQGAVISEFPFGRKADRRTFPMRNRLVSGVAQGVIVVESASSGGSLITAQFAADQGRTVFAIPGRIDQPSSAGCHKLIREGATLIRSAVDVIKDLRPYMNEEQYLLNFDNDKKETSLENASFQNLNKSELKLVNELKEGEQLSLDELSHRTGLSIAETMSHLTLLELNRYIKKYPSGKYEII
ncbi:DNA-processing protein DprA [Opitutales bacterium]|uniref:DNA-processing protein DprA n=1 Tax=Candidatus Seribacter sulfatis TaxID=3381756 RepID=UPI002A14549C|nr:DNA-processing protein DprA [Opitutales bacterium]